MASDLSASSWSLCCISSGTVFTVSDSGSCRNDPSMSKTFLDPFLVSAVLLTREDAPVLLLPGILFFLKLKTLKYK